MNAGTKDGMNITSAFDRSDEECAMTEDISAHLKQALIQDIDSEDAIRAVIFTGPPDPDSIGAAIGMKHIIVSVLHGHADIVMNSEASHPQNKTLCNVLNVQAMTEEELLAHTEEPLVSRYNKFIFVDLIPTRLKWYKDLPVSIVIDHHKGKYEHEGSFIQIKNVGSSCTLIWQHMKNLNVVLAAENGLSGEDEEGSSVATAMLMGIKTDTNDLLTENTTELDFQAYADLTRKANRKYLAAIINYKLPSYYFELKGRLELSENVRSEDSFFTGCVGCISSSGKDCIPMFAEERLRMEGITTSVVFGFVEGHLIASLRTSNASIDAHSIVQKIFGKDYAGGKPGCAAAKVPLGVLSVDSLPQGLEDKSVSQYRDVVIHKIRLACSAG